MISKNFYWWLVSILITIGLIINLVFSNWLWVFILCFLELISWNQYLKYRRKGE